MIINILAVNLSKFCENNKVALFAIMSISATLFYGNAQSETFQGMKVTVRGSGKPVLMIPGLNSAAAVWDETCEQLQPAGVQCHIVQLPGFAGQPAASLATSDRFLDSMRDRLLAYIAARKLHKPILVGHSLGGVLVLEMALKNPGCMERLIIVDALPFSPAALDPSTTVGDVQAMAEAMRLDMLSSPIGAYQSQLKADLVGMTRRADRMERLTQWWLTSDRATTVQAMYEMFTTDLRDNLAAIPQPTLVLGAWAGLAIYGGTQSSVRKTFEEQYRKLKDVRIELSEAGHHFLMWDDNPWLVAQIKQFIKPAHTRRRVTPDTNQPEPHRKTH